MVHVAGEITIDRPVEEVFDLVADQRNEPRFNPQMRAVELLSDEPIGPGSRFRAETMSGHRVVPMVIELTGFERPTRLASTTHLDTMDLTGSLTFTPVTGGTRMGWSWDVEPRGWMKAMKPIVGWMGRRQERRIWTGLKRLLEGGPSAPEVDLRRR